MATYNRPAFGPAPVIVQDNLISIDGQLYAAFHTAGTYSINIPLRDSDIQPLPGTSLNRFCKRIQNKLVVMRANCKRLKKKLAETMKRLEETEKELVRTRAAARVREEELKRALAAMGKDEKELQMLKW